MTEPSNITAKQREPMAEIMFESLRKRFLVDLALIYHYIHSDVPALCMKPQSLLSMYSYGATTGVIGVSVPPFRFC